MLSYWLFSPGWWPSLIKCSQTIITLDHLERLGSGTEVDKWLLLPNMLAGLIQISSGIRSMPAWELTGVQQIKQREQERSNAITEVNNLHTVLEEVHKNASENNNWMMTKAQNMLNPGTYNLPNNFQVGDYDMKCSMKSKRHKFRPEWGGQCA